MNEKWAPLAINTRRYEIELPDRPKFIHRQHKFVASHITLQYQWTNNDSGSLVVFWTLYVNQIRLGHTNPRVGKLHPGDFRDITPPNWLEDIVERGKPRLD